MSGERYHPTMGIEWLLARTTEKMAPNIQHQEWWAWGVERQWFCHAVDRGLCDDCVCQWSEKQAEKEREEIIKCMVRRQKLARTKQLHQEKRKEVVVRRSEDKVQNTITCAPLAPDIMRVLVGYSANRTRFSTGARFYIVHTSSQLTQLNDSPI
ncbi:hypothetical protein B0H19DRAFT_1076530 [Mycena capillaripes]|nr:hypothetical protein B0H19DRAFT_1076530 [Mycena capillaripes]